YYPIATQVAKMAIPDDGPKILGETGANAQNLELLLKYLDRLVPFVGAGLSFDFGYPSWSKLLQDLADQAGVRPKVDALLANNQFEEAAQVLAAFTNLLDDAVRQTFDEQRLPRPLGRGAVRHLTSIAQGPVLTTNFDRVLEAAFEDAGRQFSESFPGSRIREAHRAIQMREHVLLKLHGDYLDAATRVLTRDEYTREYGSLDPDQVDINLPLPSVLGQALSASPLLFLGCSLKDDRTTRVIARIAKRLQGTMHFALLPESEMTEARRKQLDSWNIRPLFFPTGEFEKIDQFLAFLAEAVARLPGGEWNPLIVANIPGAKRRALPEMMAALLAAVRDPKGSITLTAAQIGELVRYSPCNFTEYRLARIAEWSQPRYKIDRRFVSLTLLIDQGEDAQGVRWTAPESRRFTDLREVLKARPDDPVLVLLGAPGSGKSTLLRRFQLDTAVDTLQGGGDDLVTFFLWLNAYKRKSGQPLDWVNAEWMRLYPHLPQLNSLLAEGRVLLLLDGINEMPHRTPEEYDQRVGLWRDFIQSMVRQGNRALFSCRSLDYGAPLSSKDLPVPQVVVQPMDDAQIQAFLQAYVPGQAERTWQELRGTAQLSLFRTPYFLSLLCEQVKAHNAVPKGRASLFTGFVRQALNREITGGNALFQPDTLLTEKDRLKLTQSQWSTPFELPERGVLIPALSELAYSMQEKGLETEGAQVRISYDNACDLLKGKAQETILKAGVALNVLDEDPRKEEILFFHQLLQEFFAARRLAENPRPQLVRVEWQAPKVSPTLKKTLATLADSDPLPLLRQTGWEETTLLASVMAREPEAFIQALMEVNLPLAARCAAMPELPAAPGLKRQIQQALVERTQDMRADVRARIAAGLALGNLGDPRFERPTGPEGDYLLPPSATIPAGEYPMGSDEGLYDDEAPAHTVRLEAFQIGVFPVTNAEYALFIAAGGYADERWWETEAAKAWRRGEGSSEGQKQQWRDDRKTFQSWSEEHIKNLVKQNRIASRQATDWITIRNWAEDRFESWLEENFPTSKRHSEPAFWNDETYNNPSQAVVGICWHEARAYCAWLSAQAGRPFRLPTEAEFEAAARGAAGRKYPYGQRFDSARSNTFESHIRRTTPVGIFQNATPEGVFDLSGNVYTWTSSAYQPYPYEESDGREDPNKMEVRRVLRGGSWFNDQVFARAANRGHDDPNSRNGGFGFRVVGVVPSP
ncbi:MAG: SUMF1/EgtB/PvdO family nonheme iron enzyme, partial [Terriglobia bacterium]